MNNSQKQAYRADGMPVFTIAQIESQLAQFKTQQTATEKWMSAKGRLKMAELERKDKKLRDAFEMGYRMKADSDFGAAFFGILGGFALIGLYTAIERFFF